MLINYPPKMKLSSTSMLLCFPRVRPSKKVNRTCHICSSGISTPRVIRRSDQEEWELFSWWGHNLAFHTVFTHDQTEIFSIFGVDTFRMLGSQRPSASLAGWTPNLQIIQRPAISLSILYRFPVAGWSLDWSQPAVTWKLKQDQVGWQCKQTYTHTVFHYQAMTINHCYSVLPLVKHTRLTWVLDTACF